MDTDEVLGEDYFLAEDVEFPDDDTDEGVYVDVVVRVVDFIADLEWQLYLDDSNLADFVDDALYAGWQLVLTYSELHNMPNRDRVLSRLRDIVDQYPTPTRMRLLHAVFASLAAHPTRA